LSSWLFLALGIILEVMGTTCMKLSEGFTRTTPSILMFVFWGLGFGFLSIALKRIDIGIAYAIWSGSGIAAMALIGIWWFNEAATPLKIISLLMVVGGVFGLNLSGGSHSPSARRQPTTPSPAVAGGPSAASNDARQAAASGARDSSSTTHSTPQDGSLRSPSDATSGESAPGPEKPDGGLQSDGSVDGTPHDESTAATNRLDDSNESGPS
jgi:small multidrug resistance pump